MCRGSLQLDIKLSDPSTNTSGHFILESSSHPGLLLTSYHSPCSHQKNNSCNVYQNFPQHPKSKPVSTGIINYHRYIDSCHGDHPCGSLVHGSLCMSSFCFHQIILLNSATTDGFPVRLGSLLHQCEGFTILRHLARK